MTIHIMLDLETWGTTPGSDIRSIGACVFDPHTGRVCDNFLHFPHDPDGKTDGSFYVACDNPVFAWGFDDGCGEHRKWPLTRDPQTVQWWSEQSEEAQAAFANPVPLGEALHAFNTWLHQVTFEARIINDVESYALHAWDGLRIWSHGANFDPGILAAVFRAVGCYDPIHYRAPRDTRTIFEAASLDPATCLNDYQHPGAIYHHALHDAAVQARAVCDAYRRLDLQDPLSRQMTPGTRIEGLLALQSDTLLHRFSEQPGWELSQGYEEGESWWQVHQVNGGVNDREWVLVSKGATAPEAVKAALDTL